MELSDYKYEAGVWEQVYQCDDNDGFSLRSRHLTLAAAQNAALRYARQLRRSPLFDGGSSWAGGYREIGASKTTWVEADAGEWQCEAAE